MLVFDEIPARILKECALEISPSLCFLFSTSLKAGKVPDEWKKSNVTPVHKKDSRENAILHRKLYTHGLRGSILLWFKDYLTDRCQRVVLETVALEWSPVASGVPQGSNLGPLLFTIFINTLPDSLSPGSQAALYADDSNIYRPITSLVDSMALQHDLNNLKVWSSKNSIQFNPSKCKILTVTRLVTILFAMMKKEIWG